MRRQPEKKKNLLQGSTAAPTMRLRAGHASPVPCRPNSTNGPQPSTRAEQFGWMQLRAMQEMQAEIDDLKHPAPFRVTTASLSGQTATLQH